MADRDDFIALQEQITAMPTGEVENADIPIEIVSKEAEALHLWVQDDKELFLKANFDWTIVESLPKWIGALRYSEVVWGNLRITQKDAQKEFAEKRVIAEIKKNEALVAMDFAFFGHHELEAAVVKIREGTSNADVVMDMPAVCDLGTKNKALLKAINFDMSKLDEIAELGVSLGKLLGASDVEKLSNSAEKIIRDKAYTFLVEAVEKIRRCGKYVCDGKPERYKGYISQYTRKINRKARKKKSDNGKNGPVASA
jgi:hypothetical protein